MVAALPTSLDAEGVIAGHPATWHRELATQEGRTTYARAAALTEIARSLRQALQEFADQQRSEPPLLPLIAYYGTGRLWSEHKLTKGKKKAAKDLTKPTAAYVDCLSPSSSYGHFVIWFENVVREAQNESQTGVPSPHQPNELLQAVRRAVDVVLRPTGWQRLDWDFLQSEIVAHHSAHGRLPVSLLSDGIRNLIALVADLAHRAVRLNPHMGAHACQEATGIVLIDEDWSHLATTEADYQEVRDRLNELQGLRCAYCESDLSRESTRPHVEHFERRSRVPQKTFDWDNLFRSCTHPEHCGKFKDEKAGQFTVSDILKPDQDAPRRYLFFASDGKAHARAGLSSADEHRADETIRVFALNCDRLSGCRRVHLKPIPGHRSRLAPPATS